MNKKSDLSEIMFEGVTITPTRGVYKCPFYCWDKRFPSPKYKTEKGFMKHLSNCNMKPSSIKEREEKRISAMKYMEEKRAYEKELLERKKKADLESCSRKIGDTIFYVQDAVISPTHELRGGRNVRVRYENRMAFYARSSVITSINWDGTIYYNSGIREGMICASMQEAVEMAIQKRDEHEEYLMTCARCR